MVGQIWKVFQFGRVFQVEKGVVNVFSGNNQTGVEFIGRKGPRLAGGMLAVALAATGLAGFGVSPAAAANPPACAGVALTSDCDYVVPAGVTSIKLKVRSGSGGTATRDGSPDFDGDPATGVSVLGGKGAEVTAVLAVTPGETLRVVVGSAGGNGEFGPPAQYPGGKTYYAGGAGGTPGGGNGGTGIEEEDSTPSGIGIGGGGGGGGYSAITKTDGSSIIVAGGGGGGGERRGCVSGSSGDGAANNTAAGGNSFCRTSVFSMGGTSDAGGAGTPSAIQQGQIVQKNPVEVVDYTWPAGGSGSQFQGGIGASADWDPTKYYGRSNGGGGGGGGYYGGGGGGYYPVFFNGTPGGAGSSYVDPAVGSAVTYRPASVSGNGEVSILGWTAAAPTIDSATTGNQKITLDWSAPTDTGGTAITSYKVRYSTDGQVFTDAPNCGTDPNTTNCAITGLDNGVDYQIQIAAVNNLGPGNYASPSTALTPSGPPDAPTGLNGTATNQATNLSWSDPDDDGGKPITGYRVQVAAASAGRYNDATGTCSPVNTTVSTNTSCTASGLQNGRNYYFKIAALNTNGTGTYSIAKGPFTPTSTPTSTPAPGPTPIPTTGPAAASVKPGKPQITQATGTDRAFSLAFIAPPAPAQAQIATYRYSTDNGRTWAARTDGTTASPLTIAKRSSDGAPLVNGTSYTIRIAALARTGLGAASDPITGTPSDPKASRPAAAAAAPAITAINLIAGGYSVTFAPGSDGGLPITNYQYTTNNGSAWKTLQPAQTRSPIKITTDSYGTPLKTAASYSIGLRALTRAGTGTPSTIRPSAPAQSLPAKPAIQTATFTQSTTGPAALITIPNPNPDESITAYYYSTDNGNSEQALPLSNNNQYKITTPSNNQTWKYGTPTQITIRAKNSVGYSPRSNPTTINPVTVPGKPTRPSLISYEGGGNFMYGDVGPNPTHGTDPITGWEYSTDNGKTWKQLKHNGYYYRIEALSGSCTDCRIKPLTNYTITTRARNKIGPGPQSPPQSTQTKSGPVAAPRIKKVYVRFAVSQMPSDCVDLDYVACADDLFGKKEGQLAAEIRSDGLDGLGGGGPKEIYYKFLPKDKSYTSFEEFDADLKGNWKVKNNMNGEYIISENTGRSAHAKEKGMLCAFIVNSYNVASLATCTNYATSGKPSAEKPS